MEKQKLMDKLSDFSQKIAAPITKIARIPAVRAVQNGMIAITPLIIVGSIFITLYTFASPSIGDSGKAIIPFLEPYAGKLALFNSLTMGILAFYAAISISHSYGEILGVDTLASTLLGVASFLMINLNEQNGSLSTAAFGATGLFTTIIVTLISVKAYKFMLEHKLTIKLPDSVPSNVLGAFTSLIPCFVILTICWLIRTILDIDINSIINSLITPLIKGGDNIVFFSLRSMCHGLFWTVGLHFDNMVGSVIDPLVTIFDAANVNAYAANEALPHIFTSGLYRITIVPAIFYPPLILMLTSKLKQIKTLGVACLPSALFCITEPITFGFLAFNPYFIIPMILCGLLGGIITYGATMIGLVAPFHAVLPWATPTFLYGLLGSGVGALVIQLVIIALGVVIYYPFFKSYEKDQLAKASENN